MNNFAMTYCDRFDGVPFFARGIVLMVAFPPGSCSSGWVPHEHVSGCWLHEEWANTLRYEIWRTGLVFVVQRLQNKPSLGHVEHAIDLIGGARPIAHAVMPLSLRVPLVAVQGADFPVPPELCRCKPVRSGKRYQVLGTHVELRVSATRSGGKVQLWAEAFPFHHVDRGKNRRALLFVADARKLPFPVPSLRGRRLWGVMAHALLQFADGLAEQGLVLDVHHKARPRLAVARHVPGIDDVVIDMHLPTIGGVDRLVALPNLVTVPISTDADLDGLVAHAARTESWHDAVEGWREDGGTR